LLPRSSTLQLGRGIEASERLSIVFAPSTLLTMLQLGRGIEASERQPAAVLRAGDVGASIRPRHRSLGKNRRSRSRWQIRSAASIRPRHRSLGKALPAPRTSRRSPCFN